MGTTQVLGILRSGRSLVTMPTELSRFQDDTPSRITNNKDL